jgi:hypothetical protein
MRIQEQNKRKIPILSTYLITFAKLILNIFIGLVSGEGNLVRIYE